MQRTLTWQNPPLSELLLTANGKPDEELGSGADPRLSLKQDAGRLAKRGQALAAVKEFRIALH
jgi:hypothetical protein